MAPAGRKSTPTWTWVRDLEPLILEICGSPSYCGPWLVKQIAAGLVRWRARATLPPDEPLDSFWQRSNPAIDFKDCKATGQVINPPETIVGFYPVTLLGLELVREDIEALRPAGYVARMCDPAEPAAPNPRSAGRGPMAARDLMEAECFRRFGERGFPANRGISKCARSLLEWYERRFGEKNSPEFRTVRTWVGDWIQVWKSTLPLK
jgi:hypothetical protein